MVVCSTINISNNTLTTLSHMRVKNQYYERLKSGAYLTDKDIKILVGTDVQQEERGIANWSLGQQP